MANNYMFLCYRPTGRIIRLAKRMGWGWYDAIAKEYLEKFLEQCEDDALEPGSNQDAFCLLMEDDKGLADCHGQKWKYDGERGDPNKFEFVKFEDTIDKSEEDPCPKCGTQLIGGDNMSGIKCPKCDYWFCF